MRREQAIFFEVLEDMCVMEKLRSTEPLIFIYDQFIRDFDFESASDLDIQKRATDAVRAYEPVLSDIGLGQRLYHQRHDILEKLDLEQAPWTYEDYDGIEPVTK